MLFCYCLSIFASNGILQGLEVGGELSDTYTGDGISKTRGFNPPKQYEARYTAPNGSDFLAAAAPQATPAQAQIPAPVAPPASPSSPTPEQVAAVKAAGIDPSTVFPGYVG